MGDWKGLFAHAAARHNAVNTAAGEPFGIPKSTLRQRARREAWGLPYPSVVVLPGTPDGFWTRASALLASLATPQVRESAVTALSHRSAAWIHGLAGSPPMSLIEVLRTRDAATPPRRGAKVRASRTLHPENCTTVEGLPVTSPARTVRDLALQLDHDRLRACVITALQLRAVTVEALAEQLDTLHGTRGRRRLEAVLSDLQATPVDSPFEFEVVTAVRDRGLRPLPCFPWRCPDGRIIHLDLAFPEVWVAAECDGRGKYADDRTFSADRVRWSQASPLWSMLWIDSTRWRQQREAILDDVCRRVYTAERASAPAPRAKCSCVGCVRRGYARTA